MRPLFSTLYGLSVPPFMVGSLAVITHSTPDTTPTPEMTPPPSAELGAPGRQRAELEERRVAVEQQLDALARHQLAALAVARDVLLAAGAAPARAARRERELAQKALAVAPIGLGAGVDASREDLHDQLTLVTR